MQFYTIQIKLKETAKVYKWPSKSQHAEFQLYLAVCVKRIAGLYRKTTVLRFTKPMPEA